MEKMKWKWKAIMAGIIFVLALMFFASTSIASAATIYVPDGYAKIQWAIDNATAGDTIIVRDGTYSENVDVNTHLKIKSENGPANCIVDAENPSDHVFEVRADYVDINGFTVNGATDYAAGIYLEEANYCNILNNNYSNNNHGIELHESNNNKLSGNIMVENGIVILGYSLDHYTHEIDTSNKVNGKPVYYWNGVTGGKIPEGAGQVILVNCKNAVVENHNLNDASIGLQVAYSTNITIKNNNCSNNNRGICLVYSTNNIISNNICSNNKYNGIYLDGSGSNIISNNICSNSSHGIFLWCPYNNSISNNICSNNKYGIFLYYYSDNSISNNTCSNNEYDGIHLDGSDNNSISNNTCSNNNADGISDLSGFNNSISSNTCSNNKGNGIYLSHSDNNNISNNNCSNNEYGIHLEWYSNNNVIYLNNFINNTDNVHSSASTNIWNSTSKISYTYNGSTYTNYLGNYWDDYTGSDANGDGIGDTSYSIDSDQDYHPLMEPFEHYIPTEAKPTVSITTDKYEYTTGDTMLINIALANPTEEWQNVKFLWRLDLPDYGLYLPIMNNKSLRLPPGYDKTRTVPWTLPSWGFSFNATWYVALYDVATSELICEDTKDWRYVPIALTKEEIVPGEIAKEVKGMAEEVELPG